MTAFVTAMTSSIDVSTLMGTLTDLAPLIVTGVLVGFAIGITRRVIKGLSNGKGRV